MKIGTSLWGFREMDIESVLAFCAEADITSIEAQIHPLAPGHFRMDMSDAELGHVVACASEYGVAFEGMALSNDFTTSADRMAGEVDGVMAGLAFARRLGVSRVRIFAGWRRPEDVDDATFERMVVALRAAVRRARELGIRLGLENHGGITATAACVRRILDAVGEPSLGLLYDPANFVRSDEDPLRALSTLRGRLVYTHAKDLTARGSGGAVCSVGEGVMNWSAILDALSNEPDGLVIIEQTSPADVFEATRKSFAAIRAKLETSAEVRP